MYDHILAQAGAFAEVIERNRAALGGLAERIAGCRKLFLVGIGTSHHAAQIAGHLFREYAPGIACEVWHAFDFALYGPALAAEDVIIAISHRGTKRFTLQSLERGKRAGCTMALVSGQAAPEPPVALDFVYPTVAQEQSSAHTVSFTGAVGVLADLARQIAGNSSLETKLLVEAIPSALSAALASEDQMAAWAEQHQHSRRIWLVGGGPTAVVAQEVALKIKEASYLQAEGLPVETLLHGPFQCCEADDLFVLIAPRGAAQPRLSELREMIRAIGARQVMVTDDAALAEASDPGGACLVPAVPPPFQSLVCLLPLQLFTYHLALVRGANPDCFRLNDARFAAALGGVRL